MSKIEEQFRVKFAEYSNKIYSDQAKIFLNAFWEEGLKGEAEAVWKFTQKFIELDAKKKKEGHDLDEFEAHKFLESLGETMTVVALRERLRTIDLDSNNRMSLVEYLIFRYKKKQSKISSLLLKEITAKKSTKLNKKSMLLLKLWNLHKENWKLPKLPNLNWKNN